MIATLRAEVTNSCAVAVTRGFAIDCARTIVLPEEMPVTTPSPFTEPTDGLSELQRTASTAPRSASSEAVNFRESPARTDATTGAMVIARTANTFTATSSVNSPTRARTNVRPGARAVTTPVTPEPATSATVISSLLQVTRGAVIGVPAVLRTESVSTSDAPTAPRFTVPVESSTFAGSPPFVPTTLSAAPAHAPRSGANSTSEQKMCRPRWRDLLVVSNAVNMAANNTFEGRTRCR